MKIDCRDLVCPEPVLNTKKSLELLDNNSKLNVLVNTNAAKENVIRFAKNAGHSVSDKITEDGLVSIVIVKSFTCEATKPNEDLLDKVLFLRGDRVGEGELGSMLIVGFLKSMLELSRLPKTILCVNKAVLLTTADDNSDIVGVLKIFEARGVEIFSCGVCLDFYRVSDSLKIGQVGDAYGAAEILLNSQGTITL